MQVGGAYASASGAASSTGNITWDGSYGGAALGTFTPETITASSHVFTIYVPPLSETILDVH